MAVLSAIREGLQIAEKYVGGDATHVAAEHDVVYLYPIKNLSPEDEARLIELKWRKRSDGWEIFV